MLTNASPPFGDGYQKGSRPPPCSAVHRISYLRREEISRHRSAIGLFKFTGRKPGREHSRNPYSQPGVDAEHLRAETPLLELVQDCWMRASSWMDAPAMFLLSLHRRTTATAIQSRRRSVCQTQK
jgi:hypothetical protein